MCDAPVAVTEHLHLEQIPVPRALPPQTSLLMPVQYYCVYAAAAPPAPCQQLPLGQLPLGQLPLGQLSAWKQQLRDIVAQAGQQACLRPEARAAVDLQAAVTISER